MLFMSKLAVRVEGLSKKYRIGTYASPMNFRETLVALVSAPVRRKRAREPRPHAPDSIWALKDVSFEVRHGQILGIIGRNGAGKSTLLKILSRITAPTEGYGEVNGRIRSLLEVGIGFHPELTGRENVYLNGAILGMRRTEIASRFDEIVAFAEVEKFLDTPVKHYSSGMYLRLAFAVAAHLEPEILIVDEVLAVGDLAFQSKCLGKMSQVASEGRTVLLVSHNLAAVQQLCTRALIISGGRLAADGPVDEVIRKYAADNLSAPCTDLAALTDRKGDGDARFSSMRLETLSGVELSVLSSGHAARVVLGVIANRTVRRAEAVLCLRDGLNQRIVYLDSRLVGAEIAEVSGNTELVCDIPVLHVAPGKYRLELILRAGARTQDWLSDAGSVEVTDGNFHGKGVALTPGNQIALMEFSWAATSADVEPQAFARAAHR
jgi:lipopolysaccharide transport system ATP-binding protein